MTSTVMTSVLFTDLVDSTALASRLGRQAADDLRRVHFELLRGVVTPTGGVEVKNLGDGLMVTFTSPSRALACAVGMQQALERHNRRAPEPLHVRIGLSVGEAVEEDGDYFGDPVVEAARLCAAARGGQILATALVQAMVGRHVAQTFVDQGALALKGLPEPVEAVEVVWEPASAEGQIPLPARLVGGATESLFGFFGRAGQLEELAWVRKQCFGDPRVNTVFVSGEAGIGKTTLIAHSVRDAHEQGATVLFGGCDEDLAVPYRPWIDALSHLVQHNGADLFESLPAAYRRVLARLIPSAAEAPAVATVPDPETERLLLLEAVGALLRRAAETGPIVVVLDDLHWADAATVQLLRHMVVNAGNMPVLIVGSYRDTDLGRSDPLTTLLADLHREPCVTRVKLVGLTDEDVMALVAAAAGHELDDTAIAVTHALRRETDGNPFFTAELLRHLGATGAITRQNDGRWVLRGELDGTPLPVSIRDVVARRIARLGDDAVQVLSVASVIGRVFEIELLAAVVDLDEDSLIDVLDAASSAGLVSEHTDAPGRYQFSHALIQHTLYEDLSALRRQRIHHRVGEVLERTVAADRQRVAELAHHWLAATRPAEIDKALRYTLEAGDAALAALAPDDAARWYRHALDLVSRSAEPHGTARCRALVGLGAAQSRAGLPEHRATLAEAAALAQELGDADLLVAAIFAGGRSGGGTTLADTWRVEVIHRALDAVGDADSGARARLLVALAHSLDAREWKQRRALGAEATAVARRLGDDVTLLAVLNGAYQTMSAPETLEARRESTAEAIELADRLGHVEQGFVARLARVDCSMQAADLDEVDRRLEEMQSIAASLSLAHHRWMSESSASWRALLDGRVGDAEAANDRALDVAIKTGQSEAFVVYGGQLMQIRNQQGRLAEIVDLIEQTVEQSPALPELRATRAFVLCEAGRHDDARALLDRELAADFDDVARTNIWLPGMGQWAHVAIALGHREAAAVLYDALSPFAAQVMMVFVVVMGAVARPLGRLAQILDRHDEAEAHLTAALAIHERLRAPYWTACTQLDLADVLTSRGSPGDTDRAAELTRTARATAAAHGYGGLLRRAAPPA
ncbi:MAG: AAA family ATPase [Actinobacteria bacterium]|nr:AAA family ATPase [Actinomycetota bacterium]